MVTVTVNHPDLLGLGPANGEVAWWTRSLFKSGSTLKSRCDIFLSRWICTRLGSKRNDWNAQHRDDIVTKRRGEPSLKGEHGKMERWNMTCQRNTPKFLLNFFTRRCVSVCFGHFYTV